MALQSPRPAAQDAMAAWWPSRYGAGDEAGALNEVTPAKGLEAIRLASTAVNPTQTIIANALRVADHIAGRLGAASQHRTRPEPVAVHA